ncbi:hypothetical protein GLOTRDRAFT_123710 [Gloeophyllum trabeum ATCC 11539]|uniref:Uncharacterized protein n=1 Tax=Gloeophyllum trabeum (strain ATCC 11539 / FP-39264 / Madison 617) TaxID=670483 RepID=S7RYD1_GLOTA|nr:uncharacterized protein GLOTRDRAFT_123710 [Gloeophyllum trabeum ATCC 11539]EPQ59955.1 hypothetical protein GLOTRDRAFT_123710 [Gloeophyllum trabeum ATCC 11539]
MSPSSLEPHQPCLKDRKNVLPSGVVVQWEGGYFKEQIGLRTAYPFPVFNNTIHYSIFIHSGDPHPALGHPGDAYVDLAGGRLWGKVGQDEWKAFTSMQFNLTNTQVLYHPYFPQRRLLHIDPKGNVVWTISDTARGWKAEARQGFERALARLIECYTPKLELASFPATDVDGSPLNLSTDYITPGGAPSHARDLYLSTGDSKSKSSVEAIGPALEWREKMDIPDPLDMFKSREIVLEVAGDRLMKEPSPETALTTHFDVGYDLKDDPSNWGALGDVNDSSLGINTGKHRHTKMNSSSPGVYPGQPGSRTTVKTDPETSDSKNSNVNEEDCVSSEDEASSGRFPLSYCRADDHHPASKAPDV